ncbi:MAG: TonB-dependent receptor [Methylohalobius crimeensis]
MSSPLRLLLPLLGLPAVALAAQDQASTKRLDTLTVTASRVPVPLRRIGSSVTVITAEDIAARQAISLADALRSVPGLDVVRAGGLGQQTSVFLRGANSNQTLVLIDGVEANDPSNPGGLFDFANLTVDNIERIEILRGPQSTLYGGDAIGGVINIITQSGQAKPGADFSAEGGSFGSWRLTGNSSGRLDRFRYSVAASHLRSRGFSAADRRLDGNSEDDGYLNTTVSARLGWRALDNLDLDGVVRYNRTQTELDDCGGPHCDDPNERSYADQVFGRLQGKLDLFDGFWNQQLRLSYTLHDRNILDDPDAISPFAPSTTHFIGEKYKVDWQNTFRLIDIDTLVNDSLVAGITDERETASADDTPHRSASTLAYYAENRLTWLERFITTAGIRQDDPNHTGDKVTWRVTQAILIPETGTKLRGSYGKGFKAPTLYQLFAPAGNFGPIGNSNLKPESSRGWEVGFDQSFWDERILLGATYFRNDFRNLIDFAFGQGYLNLDRAESEGVETYLEIEPFDFLTLRGNYTYTRTEDETTGKRLFRRPSHKGSVDADFEVWENTHLHLNVLAMGSRDDMDFSTGSRVRLASYAVVNLAARYRVNRNLEVFGRVDNLLDKRYQEVSGFGTSNVAGYGGVKLSF